MSNPAETGHVNNFSGFKTFIEAVTTMGPPYQPSNVRIQIATMNAQWTSGLALHNAFETLEQSARNPINMRDKLFEDTHKLVTRTLNYLKSTGASKAIIADVKGLADRFRGHGVKVKRLADGSKDPNHVSTSHQGFQQRADTFRQILALYASEGLYAPNEPELQLAFLQARADALDAANNEIVVLLAPVSAAMIARDKVCMRLRPEYWMWCKQERLMWWLFLGLTRLRRSW